MLAAGLLAIALIWLSELVGARALEGWPRLFGAGASGARGLLATVASSMVTVAGVVFSITLVALSQTSSQYTSRVLRNFMSDRGNQVVLGAFLGIFAYCLIVLRTIRGGDEGTFVPSIAVFGGLLLAFAGVAVLIFFIHHIATLIQASNILATIAADTVRAIDTIFPDRIGSADPDEDLARHGPDSDWRPIRSSTTGYVQTLDAERLLALACDRGAVLRVEHPTGAFVIEGMPLVSLLGMDPSDADREQVEAMYAVGRQRTIEQDAAFGIRQIVDIALKALSPGINDTTTAVMCLDYLTAILVRLSGRRIESCRRSEDGKTRVLGCGPTYEELVGLAFDQIRQNAPGNVAILEALLAALTTLASCTTSPNRRRALFGHAVAVRDLIRNSVTAAGDRDQAERRAVQAITLLGQPSHPGEMRCRDSRAGGRAAQFPKSQPSPSR